MYITGLSSPFLKHPSSQSEVQGVDVLSPANPNKNRRLGS